MSDLTDDEYRRFVIMAKAILNFDTSAQLSQIKCPVLVIGSEGDMVVTSEAFVELAEFLHCPLYLYDTSFGHAVYDEAPDYKERLLNFYRN